MIEITTFRLVPQADLAVFLAADAEYQQAIAYQQPGLLRRTTARGDDGSWAVMTWWALAQDADRASVDRASVDRASVDRASVDVGASIVGRFESCVDQASKQARRYEPLPG